MSQEVFSKVLAEVHNIETLVIGGIGEPTAHPLFAEYSQKLSHNFMELTSNAFFWDDKTLETIVLHYKRVTVSVDGLPEFFQIARGFSFDVMATNVNRLIEKKKALNSKTPVIHAQLVLSKDNFDDVKELIPLLKKVGFAKFIISNLLPQNKDDSDKIIYTTYLDEKLRRSVTSWYPIASRSGIPIKLPMTKYSSEHRCVFVENDALYITADGNIAPCYRFAHDGKEYVFGREKKVRAHYFGNILDETIADIWTHPEYLDFRCRNYASRYPSCIDCDYIEMCDYITTSEADCRANEPSCADCLWCRELIECP